MGDGVTFTSKETKFLTVALVALVDSKFCSYSHKDNKYKVRCGDGSKIKLSVDEVLSLNNKILVASGAGDWSAELKKLSGDVRG